MHGKEKSADTIWGIGASRVFRDRSGSLVFYFQYQIPSLYRYDLLYRKNRSGEDLREEIEVLTKEDAMEEFMFLGLRRMQGISGTQFENCFGNTIEEIYGDVIEKLEQEKMLEVKEDKIRLTKRGIDVSNYVFCEFLL